MKIFFCPFLCVVFTSLACPLEAKEAIALQAPRHFQLSAEFCQQLLTEHKPSQGTVYQGGVDVDGNAVVPADLNAFKVPVPTKIRIPVTLQKQFSLELDSGAVKLVPSDTLKSPYVDEIPLGFVEYELESGKMTYNGRAFSSKERRLLRQKCRTILEK